jgi:hypothetical protein
MRARTLYDAFSHLTRELFNPAIRIRRRAYQPLIMADLFMGQLERTKPDFATFYTNHVAAAMHRYWGAAYPNDYAQPLDPAWVDKYAGEIDFAMSKFDVILNAVAQFVERNPDYALVVASSMGQAAKKTKKTDHFLTVKRLDAFMNALGVPKDGWEARPAMVPCHCVHVHDEYRGKVVEGLASLTVGGTRALESKRPHGALSYHEDERGFFQVHMQFDNYEGETTAQLGDKSVPFSSLGLGMMAHEDGVNCTAQHVPEGSLLIYGRDFPANASRASISALDVAPGIMKFFGFDPEPYMRKAASILPH